MSAVLSEGTENMWFNGMDVQLSVFLIFSYQNTVSYYFKPFS